MGKQVCCAASETLEAMPSPEEWYKSLPKITRGYMTGALAATLLCQIGVISPYHLYLDFDLLFGKFEIWRLVTNHLFFGKFSLPFVFSLFFLIRYGSQLEQTRFPGRSADYLVMLMFCGLICTLVAFVMELPFLAPALLSSIVYMWSRVFATQQISVFGLFEVEAFYFPWVMLAMTVLMGGSPVLSLVGIGAGHCYFFLEDVQGYSLKAPMFMVNYFDAATVQAAQYRTQNRNRTFTGGYNWGQGQSLGR